MEAVQELDVQSRTQATLSKGYADEYQASWKKYGRLSF